MNLVEEIKGLTFEVGNNFSFDLDREYELIARRLSERDKLLLKHDLDSFLAKGRFLVINTLGGSLLFLKSPEKIDRMDIEYSSNDNVIAFKAVFPSQSKEDKDARWKMELLFPNFNRYLPSIKLALIVVVGKLARKVSQSKMGYIQLLNSFDIHLLFDGKIEERLYTKINNQAPQ